MSLKYRKWKSWDWEWLRNSIVVCCCFLSHYEEFYCFWVEKGGIRIFWPNKYNDLTYFFSFLKRAGWRQHGPMKMGSKLWDVISFSIYFVIAHLIADGLDTVVWKEIWNWHYPNILGLNNRKNVVAVYWGNYGYGRVL